MLIARYYFIQQVLRALYVCVIFYCLYRILNIIRTYNEYYIIIYYNVVLPPREGIGVKSI